MNGAELITQERHEQVVKHHRTIADDKVNNNEYQLTDAASVLTMAVPEGLKGAFHQHQCPVGWSQEIWENMLKKPYKERLVIAGALIAAEIDRIS